MRRALARNVTIAVVVGIVVAFARRSPSLAVSAAFLALWPSLGGHFVEVAFLNGVRPRLPRSSLLLMSTRLLWWIVGGAFLGVALIATASALPVVAPSWHWWWLGTPMFVCIELAVHAALALRGRPNFYRGDG